MKKIILFAVITMASFSSYSQISFGGQVGACLGMGHYGGGVSSVTPSITNDPKVGFMIGAIAQVEFGKLAFRPELNFIQKGSKFGGWYYTVGGISTSDATKRTLNYIELPLNVVYNLKLSKLGKVFFGLGPAFAFGISGTDKGPIYSGSSNSYYNTKRKIKFDGESPAVSDNNHLKRSDVGLNILGGLQLDMGVFAKVGYTYGFGDIDPYSNKTYKNRCVSLSIGYMLGGK